MPDVFSFISGLKITTITYIRANMVGQLSVAGPRLVVITFFRSKFLRWKKFISVVEVFLLQELFIDSLFEGSSFVHKNAFPFCCICQCFFPTFFENFYCQLLFYLLFLELSRLESGNHGIK